MLYETDLDLIFFMCSCCYRPLCFSVPVFLINFLCEVKETLNHRFKNVLWVSKWRPNHLAGLVSLFFQEAQLMLNGLATAL